MLFLRKSGAANVIVSRHCADAAGNAHHGADETAFRMGRQRAELSFVVSARAETQIVASGHSVMGLAELHLHIS